MARTYYRKQADWIKIALALVVTALLVTSLYEYNVVQNQSERIDLLDGQLATTTQILDVTKSALQSANTDIDQLRADVNARDETIDELGDRLGLAQREINDLTPIVKKFAVVGVRGDGIGVVIPIEVKVVGGDGSISVNIKNVDLQSGTQASIRTAADIAEVYADKALDERDITVSFINEGSAIVSVDGPSAGAAITATIIAALQNKTIRTDVLATGTIEVDGSVGQVGGVSAKAEAVEDYGADIFLVPDGERVTVSGLQVVEVGNINEVVAVLLR